MLEALTLLFALLVAGGIWWYVRWSRHEHAVSRVPEFAADSHVRVIPVEPIYPLWARLLPYVLAGAAFLLSMAFVPYGGRMWVAIAVLAFVIGWIIGETVASKRTIKLESQLAEAIDHIVTSLHAGIGVVDALGQAERDMKRPLKPHITHLLMRLRLGDDPAEVCKDMAHTLPLESFRIFYYALGVQWEGGGNLAPTLATTGKFIRDRVELGRRVRARSTEARFSVLAVLALTYFLAGLMWHIDSARVEGLLMTGIGSAAVAASIILQALGAAWVAKISDVDY